MGAGLKGDLLVMGLVTLTRRKSRVVKHGSIPIFLKVPPPGNNAYSMLTEQGS